MDYGCMARTHIHKQDQFVAGVLAHTHTHTHTHTHIHTHKLVLFKQRQHVFLSNVTLLLQATIECLIFGQLGKLALEEDMTV